MDKHCVGEAIIKVMKASTATLETTPRQALDTLEKSLGLSEEELAQALSSNRRTLQRWRASTAYPQQLARQRLAELLLIQQRAQETFRGRDAVRRWL